MGFRRFLGALLIVAITATLAGLWVGSRRSTGPAARPVRPPAVVRDLYGNPLTPAVATYGIDALGGSVEDHYPGTRIERLAAPEG